MTAFALPVNVTNDDYRLAAGSPAIGMAVDPASVLGTMVQLSSAYVHPLKTKVRRLTAPFDAGARAYPHYPGDACHRSVRPVTPVTRRRPSRAYVG